MQCTPEMSGKIAEESIKAMTSQIDFIHGLALAVLGGILALTLQIILHNRKDDSTKVNLQAPSIILVSLVLSLLSMLFATLAKGSLTSSLPSIYKYDFCTVNRLAGAAFDNAGQVSFLAATQSWTFLAGVLAIAAFAWRNRGLIT